MDMGVTLAVVAKGLSGRMRVRREANQASSATLDTALTVGGTLLGALFGRKALSATNLRRASQSARKATRAVTERGDVAAASEEVARLEEEASALADAFAAAQTAAVAGPVDITTIKVPVAKAGVTVEKLWLLWE